MEFKEKLLKVQQELKVPKSLYNSFSKFNYRSAEQILEEAKKALAEYKLLIHVSDEMVQLGDRYYIKATARVTDTESDNFIETYGYAREELTKKGMDSMQITGATSSYARKYALNGLFAIDDTKDADTDEYTERTKEPVQTQSRATKRQEVTQPKGPVGIKQTDDGVQMVEYISTDDFKKIMSELKRVGADGVRVDKMKNYYGVKNFEDLTADQAKHALAVLAKDPDAV